MKPIIIIHDKTDDGKLPFTEEELKKIVSDAYESGYDDGKKSNSIYDGGITTTLPYNPLEYNKYNVTTCNVHS